MSHTSSLAVVGTKAAPLSGAQKSIRPRLDREWLEDVRPVLPDQPFSTDGVSWEDYEALTQILGEQAIRTTYDRGFLELRMPLYIHEKIAVLLGMMAHIICVEWEIAIAHARSTTFRRADLQQGVEPDNCYYIGPHADQFNDKETIDLATDPAPDLVIETDITSGSAHRIPIYAAMGVREVWRWREGNVEFLGLQPDGSHRVIPQSLVLPPFSVEIANRFLQLGRTMNQGRFDAQFRGFVRNELARP